MKIGIGLPNAVKDTTGAQLTEFARRADERGFSTLGTIDRIAYVNHDPFVALGGAAAVTERIGLMTTVLIGLPRGNDVLLAKQALSVQALSDGRFTLGLGLGAREDDYEASGVSFSGRGKRFDEQLETIHKVFGREDYGHEGPVGPLHESPPIIIGGTADATFKRAAKHADGWILGGGPPEVFTQMADKVRAAWREEGREGEPRLMTLAYFSLGPDAEANAKENFGHYYSFLGEEAAAMIADGAAKDAETVQQYVAGFADAGCDEVIFFPGSAGAEQVDLLAEAAGI